jgi:hypothetical protein
MAGALRFIRYAPVQNKIKKQGKGKINHHEAPKGYLMS